MFRYNTTANLTSRTPPDGFLNAFTVDVEDYYQVSAFERHVDRSQWGDYASRVVDNTRRLLELLESYHVRATFFILGWTAQRYPGLVREIRASGHELGAHGYWHRLVYTQSPNEFRDDLRIAQAAIADATGEPVLAYRAPSFSITEKSIWALEILVEEGFAIDSSVFPIIHDRYGIPDAEPGLHRLETPSGSIWEFPPSVVRVGGINLPVSGGGYFRLYPLALTTRLLSRIHSQCRRPFIFYVHPWEIDPAQPRMSGASWISRSRHYVNLRSTEHKLKQLMTTFRFGTIEEVIAAHGTGALSPVTSALAEEVC
ncbi:MAG: XrtA system polysaccharide deacetylase [Planctomycetota bacterium]